MNTEPRVTYGEVLRVREFRALFAAQLTSGIGDQVAKVALAILVFNRSGSAALAALAYAVTFLPWVIGGPLLSPVADRLPRKRVMVACDVWRGVIVAAMALPGLPVWVLIALLAVASTLAPPFEAARAATLPDVLAGERYVVGHALANITSQFMQVVGFVVGGAVVALLGTRITLLFDAATFGLSALLVVFGVQARAPAAAGRPMLLHDLREALHGVFGRRLLRMILLLAWTGAAFSVVPEGLAVVYARSVGHGAVATGVLTAAGPAGAMLGLFVVGRFVSPARRRALVLPLAAGAFVALLPSALHPPLPVAVALWALSGAGTSFQLAANATFVAAVPAAIRGRAFGLAQSGLQVVQGVSIAGAGALALVLPVHVVIAVSGALGLVAVGLLALRWPHDEMNAVHTVPPAAELAWTEPYPLHPQSREITARLKPLA